ncbi:hypothetical protein D3870_17365 [Noviherbaspirillum cavernae]|uniref:Peptidase S8/S53 domain-containing protein n=1 Tax=Noviherbaspirillum cavernae TaxID=2320862 RepID=A0A418X4W5_9BURK|nr:S8 family peptidase [Noviherbaspirillum cavernae]RJG07528.1 hypothetical protein D3870_17365 [Noviherbaspirillum cavernae]
MFSPRVLPPSLFALAVTAAAAGTALADDTSPAPGGALHTTQNHFLAIAALDPERSDALPAIGHINADYAYSRALGGSGVTIAVLDSGINAAHAEFAGVGKLVQGYNAFNGSADVADVLGHGTHVAGILGASRGNDGGGGMFGVAYDARLLPIKVLADGGSGTTAALDKGLRYAIGKAAIANISLGANSRYDPGALQEAVRGGLLMVIAAGNEGAAHPGWPARFAREAWANNQIIAVGAVDADNRIASFSNRAGDAAAWFLVAPGVNIYSSAADGRYAIMSGTSMATPVVSGAAALVKQLWPALRADQVADILFLTATDLGAPGIDAVYGRGLLNVEKALQPIGDVVTTSFNGRSIRLLATAVQPSAATSRLWQLAASGNLRAIGLDDFRRDYSVDLATTVSKPAALTLEQAFGSMDSRIEVANHVLADGSTVTVAWDRGASAWQRNADQEQRTRLAAFSFVSGNAAGRETAFGIGGMAANYFGAGGMQLREAAAFHMVPALANPYFSLVPDAAYAAIAQQAGGLRVKFGVLSSGVNQALASQPGPIPFAWMPAASFQPLPKAASALIEVSQSFGDAALAVSFARTNESNAYLGAQSSGALALGPGAATSSLQLTGALLLAPGLALAGQASYGVTPGSVNGSSLIAEVTAARTNAFTLALVASDRIAAGDRLSLSLSQPLRTYAGQLVLDVLSGVDADGAQTRERARFSMVPVVRELRTELNYQMPLAQDASLRFTLLVRRNPNNLEGVAAERLLAMRYAKSF